MALHQGLSIFPLHQACPLFPAEEIPPAAELTSRIGPILLVVALPEAIGNNGHGGAEAIWADLPMS